MATRSNEKKSFNADRYRKQVNAKAEYKLAYDKEVKKNEDLASEINVLSNENEELNKLYNDLLKRYEKECYHATVQDGNVINLVKLDAYREYIHMQRIDERVKYINTALYQNNKALQFVEIQDGIITINENKYKKYVGGLI